MLSETLVALPYYDGLISKKWPVEIRTGKSLVVTLAQAPMYARGKYLIDSCICTM